MRASAVIGGDCAFNKGESTPQNAPSSLLLVLDSLRLMGGKLSEVTADGVDMDMDRHSQRI